MTRKERFCWNI